MGVVDLKYFFFFKSQLPVPHPGDRLGGFGLPLQGVHRDRSRSVCDVARRGHQQASPAAYLLWRRLHVCPAAVPAVCAQDGGEFPSLSSEPTELPW